ncbi:MAG: ABC transporter ATP-binding protein [Spirochaetaceae bacterium]|nr:ABC transporter ATP-binding protein [Spirochaetaceae bacterium]
MAAKTPVNDTPVIEMRGITKRFLDNVANDQIDFTLRAGEICALLGENGAGKTTLMNILFGYYSFDEGSILIRGEEVSLTSPKDAIAGGIGMIHQHFTLVPTQTVLENIVIGTKDEKRFFLNLKGAHKKLMDIQEQFGLHVDPDVRVWTLSIGQQQKVEILKALYRNSSVLIMDEPTAVLAPQETVELFKTLKILAEQGRSVIFISHKLHEVMEISDRVVVLRNGKVVNQKRTADTDVKELANMMVGREVLERVERQEVEPGNPVLEISDLTVLNDKGLEAVKKFSLTVRRGEILGIAGVSGNGQTELCEVLFGVRGVEAGSVRIGGEPLRLGHPLSSIRSGLARIPEDRIHMGLLMDMTVEDNLQLENHWTERFAKNGLRKFDEIAANSQTLITDYSIKTDGRDALAKSLSGGNLQKIILARELSSEPEVVLASQPTRGLDVGATEYIHHRMVEEKIRGAGVVLVSDDLDEVMGLSDRIIVMYEGEIMGEVAGSAADREQIGLWMTGVGK